MENEWDSTNRVEVSLGRNVRELRKAMGWSQEDLAREMKAHGFDMHQTTVAKLENAGRPTTAGELVALGRIFHISAGRLLSSKPPSGTSGEAESNGSADAELRRLEHAMTAARKSYDDLRRLRLALQSAEKQLSEMQREHNHRVNEYHAARNAVRNKLGDAPQLPVYVEAGARRPRRRRKGLTEDPGLINAAGTDRNSEDGSDG